MENNVYLLYDPATKEAVLIDSSLGAAKLLPRIRELGLSLKSILNTHGHADHVADNAPIAKETGAKVGIHERLGGDFGLVVVRKLHIPWNREAGFGAVAPDGTVVFNEPLRAALSLSPAEERAVVREERAEIARRSATFGVSEPTVGGRITILVDDGLASGYSMLVAARYVRKRGPSELVVAVPTGSAEAVARVRPNADRLACPDTRAGPGFAVADAYREWRDLDDEEVAAIIRVGERIS